jgi:RNA polymerase sigma factor (sigma-70 family)
MNPTPLSLLERLRRSPDEETWQRLFQLYTPLIRRWVQRYGTADGDADDLVQEVCAAIAREIGEFEHVGRSGAFRTWVRTILLNRLKGYWRSRRTSLLTLNDMGSMEDPDRELERRWDQEHDEFIARRLMQMIEPEFAPATWRAFRRQVIEGCDARVTATELGISVNAVLIAKSRVLRRLREEGRGLLHAT